MKRSTTRVLTMAPIRERAHVFIRDAAADLVATLARDTYLAGQEWAHWPATTVEYLAETGFDPDGGVTYQVAPPSVAHVARIHASVTTR